METNNTQPSTNQGNDMPLYNDEMILGLFNNFIEEGGLPKVTAFKKHLDELINVKIKPLCSARGKTAGIASNGDNDWRREQKGMYSGRGAKWVKVGLEAIEETLKRLEGNDIDCSAYRTWTTQAGYAWVRYSGPRVLDKVAMAAFEVRTEGSKADHPQQLHYVTNDELLLERLDGTPHSKGIEVIKSQATPDSDDEIPVSDVEDDTTELEALDEGCEVEELSAYELDPLDDGGSAHATETDDDIPSSDDPQVWEAYLAKQGLGVDQLEDEEDFDQLDDDMF